MAIFQDPTFWVAIALLVFVAAVFRPVSKSVPKALDDRARKIKTEIDEAEALRGEAQELLAQYQRKQREAKAETEAIVRRARDEAARLVEQGTARMEAALKRREQSALERIRRAETDARQRVRAQTVDLAIQATALILAERVQGPKGDQLIDQAIRELPAKLTEQRLH
ncbi:MAG: F0F1 ATP synthase subunit B [Alphaproteobacteria bacterium]|nr:F0F1 ATP synthase subunit B [Alphaproteobacteria bacterium]